MAENKTRPTGGNVQAFLDNIEDPLRRSDCIKMAEIMEEITGAKPVMWGDSIVGFGNFHYQYASGREGDWFLAGFSPRKQSLTVYIMGYFDLYQKQLEGLGKYKHGKGCLYINKLEDIDLEVLQTLIITSIKRLNTN